MMEDRKIHRFENSGNSCVLSSPRPPRYWTNNMWSIHGYVCQITQIGNGSSYYLNEKADMCQINSRNSRYIYLRDDETNLSWNIGEGPMLESVENYSCEHSIAYTLIKSQKEGIEASLRVFVPYDAYNEILTLRIRNNDQKPRSLSTFAALGFELEGFKYPRYYGMAITCETFFDKSLNGVFCLSKHPYAPHQRYNAYICSSEPVYAYDGYMNNFLGYIGSYERPETVLEGRDCSNTDTVLQGLGGVLQHKIKLQPGEEKEIHVMIGVSENLEEAQATAARYFISNISQVLKETENYWLQKYSKASVVTPDEKINNIMNNWLKKQIEFCMVGKKGVRDNLQVAVGMLTYLPERAKEEILEVIRHQFRDGHAVLTWYPYDDTRYSDQPFWIVWAIIELIKETGDLSILDTEIEYQDGGKGPVLEHLKAAINRLLSDTGPNGLTKLFFADWNDALNVLTDPEAESVMLSEQLCLILKEMAQLSEKIGDLEYQKYLLEQYERMKALINEKAWDGNWYTRALSKNETIGSKDSEGAKIYLNSQTWALLADIVDEERSKQVLDSIDSMEHDFGFPICKPANMVYSPNIGRMGGMLPGLCENGGVYNHATAFKILMDCKYGRAEEAYRSLKKIMPDSELNPSMSSGADPHVFTSCYNTHPKSWGQSHWSWTTGTSAWALRSLYEGLLGLQRDYEGLKIEPCFVPEWPQANVVRTFRGIRYNIEIRNLKGLSKGAVRITVDGKELQGQYLPTAKNQCRVVVELI